MLSISTQPELLNESLDLLYSLAGLKPDEQWWEPSRYELHDELFRYFVGLGYYVAGHYVDRPRIALQACTVRGKQIPHDKPPPSLVRPVLLTMLESNRAVLRDLVRLVKLEEDLKASFGREIFSGAIQPDRGRLAHQVFAAYQNKSSFGGQSLQRLRSGEGAKDFTTHTDVTRAVEDVLNTNLPFALPNSRTLTRRVGVNLPKRIQKMFGSIDTVEDWLVSNMQQTLPPQSATLFAVGLALTVTARAYVADAICALVGVSLPLHRLYEESRQGTKASLDMSSPAQPKRTIVTKGAYNAYMAVGLVELLTEKPMPHLDSIPGDGYMPTTGALKEFSQFEPLARFWGTFGFTHQQVLEALTRYGKAPILQLFYGYDPKKVKGPPAYLEPMTVEDLRKSMLAHAFPALTIPAPKQEIPAKGSQSQRKQKKAESPDKSAFNICGHYITHFQLHVASELSRRLAARLMEKYPDLPKGLSEKGDKYMRVWVGSQRWGGNHLPHKEHRDGFTYDIEIPKKYLRWEMQPLKPTRKGTRSGENAIGVPAGQGHEAISEKNRNGSPIYADQGLKEGFANLVRAFSEGKEGQDKSWDALHGTPILLGDKDKPDDPALRANLVGHVSLALSGVLKWVFCSWYEHLFALRTVTDLLKPSNCPQQLQSESKLLLPAIVRAEFYWAPLDHHNHWHVVFEKSHSLGPKDYKLKTAELTTWVNLWDALGVEMISFKKRLEQRIPAHSGNFPYAVRERQTILDVLGTLQTRIEKLAKNEAEDRSKVQEQTLNQLADSICATKWGDIPSLANSKNYREWFHHSRLPTDYKLPEGYQIDQKKWQAWPPDTEPSDAEKLPSPIETETDEE